MAYDICKKCQRFFKKSGKQYCNKCDEELNISREKINQYIHSNPHASIIEIVKEADVSLKDVNVFLDTGGATSMEDGLANNTLNLREEEIKKQEEDSKKREILKLKNKLKPRRLRE